MADGTDILSFVKGDGIFNSEAAISFRRENFQQQTQQFFCQIEVEPSAAIAALPDIFMRNCQNNIIELAFSYKNVDDFFPKLKFCHIHEPSKWSNNAD